MASTRGYTTKVISNESNAANHMIHLPDGRDILFRMHNAKQGLAFPELPFEDEDEEDNNWRCHAVWYKFLNYEDGQVVTSLDLQQSVVIVLNMLSTLSKYDRYYYLLRESSEQRQRVLYITLSRFVVGVTVYIRSGRRYLLMIVSDDTTGASAFFGEHGFQFGKSIIDVPNGVWL